MELHLISWKRNKLSMQRYSRMLPEVCSVLHEPSFRAGWDFAFKFQTTAPGQHRCDCFRCRELERQLYNEALKIHKRREALETENNASREARYREKTYW